MGKDCCVLEVITAGSGAEFRERHPTKSLIKAGRSGQHKTTLQEEHFPPPPPPPMFLSCFYHCAASLGEASRVQKKFREKQHYPLKHQTNIDFSTKGLLRRPQRVNIWWGALKFQSSLAKVTFYKQEWCLSQQTCPPKPARCGQRWSSFPQPQVCPWLTEKQHSHGWEWKSRCENPPAWFLSKNSRSQ